MLGFMIRRLLQTVPVLFFASIAVFLVLRLVPGDPAATLAGQNATPQEIQQIRAGLGLESSWPTQYVRWLKQLAHGDLGESFQTKISVGALLRASFPPTLELTVAGYLVALLIGIPFGVAAGARSRSSWDWALSGYTTLALGIPGFVLGILMLLVFTVEVHWFPTAGSVPFFSDPLNSIYHLVLPALALGATLAASLARYTRTAVSDVMGQDFIRTARAKGLLERTVVVRHALRNALIPVITIAALQVGRLLAGAIVIEQVFTRPGLGRLLIGAILQRDYMIVQSSLVIFVVIFVFVNLLADISYALLDPRIRVS